MASPAPAAAVDRVLEVAPAPSCAQWLGFMGGSCPAAVETVTGLAVSAGGYVLANGGTASPSFPDAIVGLCPPADPRNAFVIKTTGEGDPVWSRVLGGSQRDAARGQLALDSGENVIIAGSTLSSDFPVTPGAFDETLNDRYSKGDAFVAKLSPEGEVLWSTYLGAGGEDRAEGVAVDADDNVYVVGVTLSWDFPVQGDEGQIYAGGYEAFLAKLSPAGELLWARFIGGSKFDYGRAVCAAAADGVVVCGNTASPDFPVLGAGWTGSPGDQDVFVMHVSSEGTAVWSLVVAGTGEDIPYAIAPAPGGELVVTGATNSGDFPRVPADSPMGPSQGQDAFLIRIGTSGELAWCRTIGGTGNDLGRSVSVDDSGGVWMGGDTGSTDLVSGALCDQAYGGGPWDGFYALVSSDGRGVRSAYLGGSGPGNENVYSLAWAGEGTLYLTGQTGSGDFPRVPCGLRQELGAQNALFLGRIAIGRGEATRRFEPGHWWPGSPVRVCIDLMPVEEATTVAVEDSPPVSWTVTSVESGGAWDAVSGKVVWSPVTAHGADPSSLCYEIAPPADCTGAPAVWWGQVSLDGVRTPITGDSELSCGFRITAFTIGEGGAATIGWDGPLSARIEFQSGPDGAWQDMGVVGTERQWTGQLPETEPGKAVLLRVVAE